MGYILECKDAEEIENRINDEIIERTFDVLGNESEKLKAGATYFLEAICRGQVSLADKFMEKNPLSIIKKNLETVIDEDLLLDTYYIILNLVSEPYRFLKAVVDIGIGHLIINLLKKGQTTPRVK